MSGRPQINRQSKPASAFVQPGQGGAPPPLNRHSKPIPEPSGNQPTLVKASPEDPLKLQQICNLEAIEQGMIFLNLFWEDLATPLPDPPTIRGIATLFDQIARELNQNPNGPHCQLFGPQIGRFLSGVEAQFGRGGGVNEVKGYLVGVGVPGGGGEGLPLFHYLLFRYRVDWHKVGGMMVGPFQEEMGRAKERLAAAHGAASRALYTFYEANQGRDDSERILNEVNQMEKQNPQDPALQQKKEMLEGTLQKTEQIIKGAETACEEGKASVAAAEGYLRELEGRGVGGGKADGTIWWLREELKMAHETVSNVKSGNVRNSTYIRNSRASLPPSRPLSSASPQRSTSGQQPSDKDFNSFMMDKLTLDDLDDEKPSTEDESASLFDGMRQKPSDASTNALRRLKEAEEMNQQSLESLQRQQASLSNVGYKLEDIDRTLQAGDHYLKSCDGYLGAFTTTVSGPTLRGRDMNRGEMGEPILDEEGNVIRYGFTNEGPSLFAPPPPTQLPPSATGAQFSGVGSTYVSSRANEKQKQKFEQQEKDLDEINAVLQNVNSMSKAVGTEVKSQDVQVLAVNAKQTDTQYNVERSTHKLNKLL